MSEKEKRKEKPQDKRILQGCLILGGFIAFVFISGVIALMFELECLKNNCHDREYLMTMGAVERLFQTEALATATAFMATVEPIVDIAEPLYWVTPSPYSE